MSKTYTAVVGADNATWLTAPMTMATLGLHPHCPTDVGGGRIEIDGDLVEMLRQLPEDADGVVDADLLIWIEGDGYKLLPT